MNRREILQALQLLDECVDHAEHPAVMLALDSLRRNLLQLCGQEQCMKMDADELLAELAPLPGLCRKGLHPALPMRLSQVILCLHSPQVNAEQEPLAQCREQAEKIRCLRHWQADAEEWLKLFDEEIRLEAQQQLARQMEMMSEVFGQLLTMTQSHMAARAAKHRADRLEEIAAVRESLCLEDVSQAQADAETVRTMTQEKLFEFSAEIAASSVLLQVKEPQLDAAACQLAHLEEVSEE